MISSEPLKGRDAERIGDLDEMLAEIPGGGQTGMLLITHDIGLAVRLA